MKAREELQRAVAVLKHIKKRAGPGVYDVEYDSLMEEVLLMNREQHHIEAATDEGSKKSSG